MYSSSARAKYEAQNEALGCAEAEHDNLKLYFVFETAAIFNRLAMFLGYKINFYILYVEEISSIDEFVDRVLGIHAGL